MPTPTPNPYLPDVASAVPAGLEWSAVMTELGSFLGLGIVVAALIAILALKVAPFLVRQIFKLVKTR